MISVPTRSGFVTLVFVLSWTLAAAPAPAVEADWATFFGSGPVNQFQDMALAADGTMFVVASTGPAISSDILTTALGPDGSVLWTSTYDGPSGGQDLGQAVALDGDWVYVTGRSATPQGSRIATIKYAALDGQEIWVRFHDLGGGIVDAADVAVAGDHTVVTTGSSYTDDTLEGLDWATVAYDADGNQLWAATYQGPGPQLFANDKPVALVIDAAGDVVVTGSSDDAGGHPDYLTIKYDGATGAEIWQRRYLGAGANDNAYALALDDAGDVYVTGISPQPGRTWATVKYQGSDGTVLWTAIDDPGQDDVVHAILVRDGAVYITGAYDPDGDDGNFNENVHTVCRQADDGALVWSRNYGDIGYNEADIGRALARDALDNLYVTGFTRSFGAVGEVLLLRYDAATGDEREVSTYDRPDSFSDGGHRIGVGPGGDVYVAGQSGFDPSGSDLLALRFPAPAPTDVDGPPPGPATADLTAAPNPFNPGTTLRFAVPEAGHVTVDVFALDGRRVAHLVDGRRERGHHEVTWNGRGDGGRYLASGLYLARVSTPAGTVSTKLVLAR